MTTAARDRPNAAPPRERGGLATNMREHTDPGLLTLTLASAQPGLQVRDRSTGTWLDVEACCEAEVDCIVLCGEALEFASAGTYAAAPHCVRCGEGARTSTVFELRIHDVSEALGSRGCGSSSHPQL